MLTSAIPQKFTIPFANAAGVGYINPIPTTPGGTPGLASLTTGFPTLTFQPEASGGNPPYGADFNGILKWITQWNQWQAAGGPVGYDSAFSAAIGGYPNGAALLAATIGNGRYWISQADNNTSNPDAAGANWMAFPDLAVQRQAPNFGNDTGTVNQIRVTLFPGPTTWASIVGMPVRVGGIVAANSVGNPTIQIGVLTPATVVNPDGSALATGQIPIGCTIDGIPLANGNFQLNSPAKVAAASAFPFSGCIMPWPNETPPSGWLEMNGSTLLISSYANLFSTLGTRYGGDGVNTFRIPDWRGQFIRGWDHGRGLDPNAATRSNAGGGLTGDHVGTTQAGTAGPISLSGGTVTIMNLNAHLATGLSPGINPPGWYPLNVDWMQPTSPNASPSDISPVFYDSKTTYPQGSPTPGVTPGNWDGIYGTVTLAGNSGSTETRPTNIYAMWVIKT